MGIAPQDQARVFERFYRVDKARSRELGGTGLGLSIVKHIAAIHQGRVFVESTPGIGKHLSRFLSNRTPRLHSRERNPLGCARRNSPTPPSKGRLFSL